MVEKDGDFRYSLDTMGGDIQPQIHVQIIRNLIDSKLDPQLSLDMPRWAFPGSCMLLFLCPCVGAMENRQDIHLDFLNQSYPEEGRYGSGYVKG